MRRSEELLPRHASGIWQQSLFPSTQEQFSAETFVSADEMGAWKRKDWLSFDPLAIARYDQKERVEVLFIKGMTRSGLSDAMIDRLLSGLEKPYCYDPSTTFFSFLENRWISLPPEQDPAEVAKIYLDELVDTQDWDTLREMQSRISQALEDSEAINE
jgi:hypothetical protein